MHPVVRLSAIALVAAVTVTCAEHTVSGIRSGRQAQFAIAPVFQQAPEGGPDIDVAKIRGVLRRVNGTDSLVTEALVQGDSAILEFRNVTVNGDSTSYRLDVQAFDADDELVFEATQHELKVKPGENAPASPALEYTAPDAEVTSIELSVASLNLDWAGAAAGDVTCLNRAPQDPANTQAQLGVVGTTADNQTITDVRVGWTSRDRSVATVDESGLVKARCSNKSTYVVARTFLDEADSVLVNVSAPAFSLIMSPDSATLERGATRQMAALVVDENGNSAAAEGQVAWHSSDPTRALVNAAGVVQALRNGRVVVTATVDGRTTVGIVQVVRPKAASVRVFPAEETLGFGMVRQYFARAIDAFGRVIGDASGFEWSSSNTSVATINATSGVVTANETASEATISAKIDGKTGGAVLTVIAALPPGTISGTVKDGSTDAPLAGATISVPAGQATSDADGNYTLGGVQAGDDITFSKTGYVPVTFYDAPAFPSATVQVRPVPLSPESSTPGTMQGSVKNALTGSGVSGMTVKAYAGLNAAPSPTRPDAQPVATTTSSSSGFTFNIAPGAYTFVASGTGYSEGLGVGVSVGGQTRFPPPIIMPPGTIGGGVVIVLTWGPCGAANVPCDLDAHLTGPQIASDVNRFHVYSATANRAYVFETDTVFALDVADVDGPGPEAVWIRSSADPGTYKFYVHDVSNATNASSLALANSSGARVDVFQDNRVIATFFPPPNQMGTLWKVFEYDGARLLPIGVIEHVTDPSILP